MKANNTNKRTVGMQILQSSPLHRSPQNDLMSSELCSQTAHWKNYMCLKLLTSSFILFLVWFNLADWIRGICTNYKFFKKLIENKILTTQKFWWSEEENSDEKENSDEEENSDKEKFWRTRKFWRRRNLWRRNFWRGSTVIYIPRFGN